MIFLNVVLPVFLIVVLGFGIRRIHFVDKFFLDKISHLAYYVALPSLLVWKIGTASFDLSFNPRLIAGSYLAVLICGLGAYVLARLLKLPPREVGSFTQGSFWGNMTYIGLPILLAAYGEEALQRGGVLIGFMNPVMNAAAVLALTWPLKGSMDWRSIVDLRSILTNPVILACMVGLILSYFKVPFPTFAVNFLRFLSDLALPLALISMGGIFPLKRSRKITRQPRSPVFLNWSLSWGWDGCFLTGWGFGDSILKWGLYSWHARQPFPLISFPPSLGLTKA